MGMLVLDRSSRRLSVRPRGRVAVGVRHLDDAAAPRPSCPREQLSGRIQHTLIGQAITERRSAPMSRRALEHGFDAAIVPPCWVWAARDELRGTAARIGSIVDYPERDRAMTVDAGRRGQGAGRRRGRRTRRHGQCRLPAVRPGARSSPRTSPPWSRGEPIGVKLMLELPLLDARQREQAVQGGHRRRRRVRVHCARGLGGDRRPGTIGYLRRSVPASMGVKASGGVKTVEQVRALLAAGADLIGTSAGIRSSPEPARSTGSLYSY